MLIVSWNVAGLKPALQKIHSDYYGASSGGTKSTANNKANNKATVDPFANYLRLHGGIDILCLQEHKIPLSQLSSRSEPHRCSTIEGYESFWSCATAQNSRGFNGAVTYARAGLVRAADGAPLGDPELDGQGRCVMTDHGTFVVFNVYVPCGRRGAEARESLRNKMKFLNALKSAMDRQRRGGKHVILVGDMNLKIDKRDIPWHCRSLNVDAILGQMKRGEKDGKGSNNSFLPGEKDAKGSYQFFPKWKWDIANHWGEIVGALQTLEAIPRQTKNPTTKETFDRFRARVKLGSGKFVMLGNNEDTAEDALECYTFDEQSYTDPKNDTCTICRKKNSMCVDTLAELMSKICDVSWNEEIRRQIADSNEAGMNLDSPVYSWMKGLLEEDGMVDVFRHFYPTAEARFTCWHQLKNKRYTNEGSRIDFTLVDGPLMDFVEPNEGKALRCGKEPHGNPLGEEAALLAATAGGLFEPGSYAGGGIAVATKRALDTQFGEAHSGMIYTPPSYSDHIAVSLLMKSSFKDFVGQLALDNDASTRKAQPHKKQRSIASFFGAAGSKSSSSSTSSRSASAGEKRTISEDTTKTFKKKSLHSFFDGSKAAKENGSSRNSSTNNKKRSVPKHSVLKHFGKK